METGEFSKTVATALTAELEELRDEVRKIMEKLDEGQLWKRPLPESNSIGHLALHVTGNINHFVGAQLGQTGYVRDREREFTETVVPNRQQLIQQLDDAVATFRRVVGGLTEEQLLQQHPSQRFGTVLKALIHVIAHFALHRGQISYIARLVSA
jgi:uncharacterized damage-inducible protein DinB